MATGSTGKPSEKEEEYFARQAVERMAELDYKGVKIDRCMNCQGVWLDAGELELVTQKAGYLGGMLKLFK